MVVFSDGLSSHAGPDPAGRPGGVRLFGLPGGVPAGLPAPPHHPRPRHPAAAGGGGQGGPHHHRLAGDPARQEPGGAEAGQVGFQSSLVLYYTGRLKKNPV